MNTWICDTCGEVIKESGHGWVEWLRFTVDGKIKSKGFRLVHSFPNSPLKDLK